MSRKTFSDYKKSIDNDLRTIIHKGKNVACYKFPFFQTILEFAAETRIGLKKEVDSKLHRKTMVKLGWINYSKLNHDPTNYFLFQ